MPAPEKLTIDTPEQIGLEFTLATLGSRFLALAIDSVLQAAAVALVVLSGVSVALLMPESGGQFGTWLLAGMLLGAFVIFYGYFVFFEIRWHGQTPGKRAIGLRAIHTSGRPMTTYEAVLRNLLRIADQVPGFYAVGILAIFVTERSQRLGDLAADTVVVHEQAAGPREFSVAVPAARTHHGASRLSAGEIALVDTFLRRRHELAGVRELRARQVAARIRERLQSSDLENDEVFLEQVAAEYRHTGGYRG